MKRNFFLTALLLLTAVFVQAQKSKDIAAYIETYKDLAISEMIRSGVPASITLAQGILESASGQSELSQRSNNHFGIKCKTEWTGEKTYHDDDEKGECFRVYGSVADSYRDHSDFLKTRSHYDFLFSLDPADYKAWAYGLKKAGYATSRIYPQQLIKLIEDNNLQEYTLAALGETEEKETFASSGPTPPKAVLSSSKKSTISDNDSYTPENTNKKSNVDSTKISTTPQMIVDTIIKKDSAQVNTSVESAKPAKKVRNYPMGVFKINSTEVIYAESGTSLFALAHNYGVAYKTFLEYNELSGNIDILDEPRLVYLAKKPKKSMTPFHLVEEGETVEEIAQLEGVNLESILNYNHIPKGRQPMPGEKVYLQFTQQNSPKLLL